MIVNINVNIVIVNINVNIVRQHCTLTLLLDQIHILSDADCPPSRRYLVAYHMLIGRTLPHNRNEMDIIEDFTEENPEILFVTIDFEDFSMKRS